MRVHIILIQLKITAVVNLEAVNQNTIKYKTRNLKSVDR
jgi:hypothetical protein